MNVTHILMAGRIKSPGWGPGSEGSRSGMYHWLSVPHSPPFYL